MRRRKRKYLLEVQITDKERNDMEKNQACMAACQEVVKEAIRHWEAAKEVQWAMWRVLEEKYRDSLPDEWQDREKFPLSYDSLTGKVNVVDTAKEESSTEAAVNYFRARHLANEIEEALL